MYYAVFLVFLAGLFLGSFLNCIIYRTSIGKKPEGRSYCPKCKHTLQTRDLIPLFSFLFLLGKCRYCKKKISLEYPLIEFLTGVLFVFSASHSGFLTSFPAVSTVEVAIMVYLFAIFFFLLLIFFYDLKYFLIPDIAVFSLIGLSFLFLFSEFLFEGDVEILIHGIFAALGAFLVFFLLFYFTKGRGMGFGDVKFVVFMGLFLGVPNIIAGLFISFLLGAIIGIILILFKKKGMKSQIPFGPFLVIGTLLALSFGETIMEFYINHLLY